MILLPNALQCPGSPTRSSHCQWQLRNLPSFGPKDNMHVGASLGGMHGTRMRAQTAQCSFILAGYLGMWKAMGDMRNRARPYGSKLQSASSSACLPAVSCCLHNASVVST